MANETGKNEERTKVPLRLDFEEHEKFDPTAELKFINSRKFCKLVSDVLHATFVDFEGTVMETVNNVPTISVFFNQREEPLAENDPRARGISRNIINANETSNPLLNRLRQQDASRRDGDRYYLTDDGMSVLEELIAPAFIDITKSKVNWKRIVVPVATTQNYAGGQRQIQFTKVCGLSIDKLAAKIYGETDEDGNRYCYALTGASSMATQNFPGLQQSISKNYMLSIMKISVSVMDELCAECGVFPTSGFDLI